MKIRRFFAADIKEGVRKVRNALGDDAVVLSNRKVDNGIELVAAIDYDEESILAEAEAQSESSVGAAVGGDVRASGVTRTLSSNKVKQALGSSQPHAHAEAYAPVPANYPVETAQDGSVDLRGRQNGYDGVGVDEFNRLREEMSMLRGLMEEQVSISGWGVAKQKNPVYTEIVSRLMKIGLSAPQCHEIATVVINQTNEIEPAWRRAIVHLARSIPVAKQAVLDRGGVLSVVGPSGSGKTTTLAKIAASFIMKHGTHSVSLVTMDQDRIGAQEQLHSYARILGIPMYAASSLSELRNVMAKLSGSRLVLVDTPGVFKLDPSLKEYILDLRSGVGLSETYLVLPASAQRESLERTISEFKGVTPTGCVITKMDESCSLGGVISAVSASKIPVVFTSEGTRVPEDLRDADNNSIACKAITLANQLEVPDDYSLAKSFGRSAMNACVQ